jgi:carboxyl-terminal processing protease
MLKSKYFTLILGIVFIIGVFIGLNLKYVLYNSHSDDAVDKFSEVLDYTEEYYFKDVNKDELVEYAISGMLENLDPHSVYIPEIQQIGISEELKGNFEGIGIEFQIINDSITVVSAISGGPSESVGILPGDRIIEIEGKNSIGYTNKEVVSNLRGEKGSEVELKIYRPFINSELSFSLVRDQIPLNTVEAALMVNDTIAYISISKFAETTIYEISSALEQLTNFGMKKLILDLRNNPGGYMDQAVKVADLFLDDNKLIVYTQGRKSDLDVERIAERPYPYENLSLAVLVNSGSASASEIVSGAIQDWDRGIIIGETTFGKGLVQQPFTLADNSAVRITISKYYTPSGRIIQRDFSDRENYYAVMPSEANDELTEVINIEESDSTKEIFTTEAGRELYANGGITPDFTVHNDDLTYYSILLRSKDLYFRYVRKYLDNNSEKIISEYGNDLQKFIEKFYFPKNEINSFISFAEENKVKFNKDEFEKDKNYIMLRLKAHVARTFWKSDGWYRILLGTDNQFKKAKELLEQNYKITG